MAGYTEKFCPHCAKRYEVFPGKTPQRRHGSPLRTCENCGKKFLDRDYDEPAFGPPPRAMTLWSACLGFVNPYGYVALGGILVCFLFSESSWLHILAVLPVFLYVFLALHRFSQRRAILQQQRLGYEMSQRRTKDPAYIRQLLDHNIVVPMQFLEKKHPALVDHLPGTPTLPDRKLRKR